MADFKVVTMTMPDHPAPQAMVPDGKVIEHLEWMLERARAGEIQGIAGGVVYADKCASKFAVGYQNDALIGALHRVMFTLTADMES